METTEEWLCTMRTRRALYQQLERAIRQLHAYQEAASCTTAQEIFRGSAREAGFQELTLERRKLMGNLIPLVIIQATNQPAQPSV